MFVYLIINHITAKIYIGKTITSNLQKYFREKLHDARTGQYQGRSHLFAAMRKYTDPEAWSVYPLISSLKTNEELCFWERVLIAQYDSQNPDIGYNICKGGEGFSDTHTEEWRQKMRIRMTGRKLSPETIAKMKAAPKTPAQLANLNREGMTNITEETRQKIRVVHTNPSQELRDRIAATLRAKIASGELKPPTNKGMKLPSESYKGRVPWNKGKKGVQTVSTATRERISHTMKERGIRPPQP